MRCIFQKAPPSTCFVQKYVESIDLGASQKFVISEESALRPILSSSRKICPCGCVFVCYLSPFMRLYQGSKGGPRGAKPVCLLEEHVNHLQFFDEKCNSIGPTIRIGREILLRREILLHILLRSFLFLLHSQGSRMDYKCFFRPKIECS